MRLTLTRRPSPPPASGPPRFSAASPAATPSPVSRSAREQAADPSADSASSAASWTAGSQWAARATTVAVWALIVCGPAALAVTLTSSSPPPAPPATTTEVVDTAGEQARASELARQLVTAWLTLPRGEEDQLRAFVDTADLTLPETPWTVQDVTVAGLSTTGAGRWSVTVGATVTDQDSSTARVYYAVPVQVDPAAGSAAALTLPAPVPTPPPSRLPALAYPYTANPVDDLATTVGDFLTAMLTGAGDVTRYVTPGATVTALVPAPYSTVTVSQVWLDEDPTDLTPEQDTPVRALVTATATTTADQASVVQYALQIRPREGRWEIAALDPIPALADTPTPTPTPTPTSNPAGPASPAASPTPTEGSTS